MKTLLRKAFMDVDKIATPTARSILLSSRNIVKENEFAFFSSLKLKNGVTKTTYSHRMRNVDIWLLDFLPKDVVVNVLDVGISTGITTVELCELFDAKGVQYQVIGMDSDLTGFLLIFGDDNSILVDKNMNPIHFEIKGKGFGYVKGTNLKHLVDRALLKLKCKIFMNLILKDDLETMGKVIRKGGFEVHRVELVCREITENPSIQLVEDSIFSENTEKQFDFIRAANILNKTYFSDERIKTAARKLRERLATGGQLLICRTDTDGQNNASLFNVTGGNRYGLVGRFGKGSDIEDLVLNLEG